MPKAIRIERTGGPEVLVLQDVEVRAPGPGEVLVRQTAVGVNYIDVYYRTGQGAAGRGVALVDPGDVERQVQRDTLPLLTDIGAFEARIHVVRSLRLLGSNHAGAYSRGLLCVVSLHLVYLLAGESKHTNEL